MRITFEISSYLALRLHTYICYSSSQQSGNWLMATASFHVKLLCKCQNRTNSLIKPHLLS